MDPTANKAADAPKASEPAKKDAAAARQLPDLYAKLAEATAMLDRVKSAGDEHLNVHKINLNVAGDEATHTPHDKKAWGDLFVKDLEAAVASVKAKISALGFDPG
jgi:hypothetical protein